MTQPPPGWPSGEPQPPAPGGWPQQPAPPGGGWQPPPPPPPAGPGGWQAPPPPTGPGGWPTTPQPSWQPPPQQPGAWPQQPAGDQPAWGAPQPGAGQPGGSWEPLGPQGGQPRPRSRGKLIASAAVVVALAAGGVVTYVAMSDTNSTGASSPQKAVQSIVTDLNKSDLVGVLDDLAPGERDALANPTLDTIKGLKRLKVLQQGADPKKVSGVTFHAQGLSFAAQTIPINDHVQIVQLTGGTLQVSSDATRVPFTQEFLAKAFPHGLPAQKNGGTTIDISKVVRDQGKPVRIATQKVGGKWYPSLFYTIADAAANGKAPSPSDAVPAVGAPSAKEAVAQLVDALLHGNFAGAVKVLSPEELAVLHDYAGLVLGNAGSYTPPDVTIKDLQLTTQQISGGATRVLLSSVTIASGSEQTTVHVDGSCLEVTTNGKQKRMCATDFVSQILSALQGFGVDAHITQAQQDAFADLLGGLAKIGVDTSQTDGKWFVNPVRSFLDITTSVLSGLKGDDLLELLGLFASLGSH